ncbi:MAG: hypothetical protein WAT74_07820 [Flavobacteriales bacterium]
MLIPFLFLLIAAILAWRLWRGRPWVRFGWVQGTLLMITVVMGLWWYSRAKLPYNSEGRWHDEEAMLVYDKGTEEVLRIGFMLCFAVWAVSMVGTARHEGG